MTPEIKVIDERLAILREAWLDAIIRSSRTALIFAIHSARLDSLEMKKRKTEI